MNQVWVFFKLLEVVMGSMCMFFHVRGSMYREEPLPHDIIYCATFLSFVMLSGLGAVRLVFTRTTVLTTQLVILTAAMVFHYFCALLILRNAIGDPHLAAINDTFVYLTHPYFAHCKQQSIASLITGTMYLMHMFHVFDLLLRMEPGNFRRQIMDREQAEELALVGGRAGLYVLSKPVDNFLCQYCLCYFRLAYSQGLHFRISVMEDEKVMQRVWHFLANLRGKFCVVPEVESDESFLSTPSVTTSDSSEPDEFPVDVEEGRGKRRRRDAANWRGASDSSSLWAQIEDRSTPNKSRSSSDLINRPGLLLDRTERRSVSAWDDTTNRQKSEILLVKQNSRILNNNLGADDAQKDSRKPGRDSSVRFRGDNAEEWEGDGQFFPRTSASQLKPESSKSESKGGRGDDGESPK